MIYNVEIMKKAVKFFVTVTMCLNIVQAFAQVSIKEQITDTAGNQLTPTVVLTGPLSIDLMDEYGLNVSITPANYSYSSVEFIINDKYTLQKDISASCNLQAKKTGRWRIQAIVDGTPSNTITVEVRYPDVSAIMNNPTVVSAMNSAWSDTKHTASSSGRAEHGFWIFVNTNTMSYECAPAQPGRTVRGSMGTKATLVIHAPRELPSSSPLQGGKYAVAHFHTHTPLTYYRTISAFRNPGPSDIDNAVLTSSSYGFPGLVYDYIAAWDNYWEAFGLAGGHSLHASAQVYTFSVNRRATPQF